MTQKKALKIAIKRFHDDNSFKSDEVANALRELKLMLDQVPDLFPGASMEALKLKRKNEA